MNTSIIHDHFWQLSTLGCTPALQPWLHDRGSLTQRIQQRCEKFTVQLLHNGLARIAYDESALLGIAPKQLAWSREVFLYADGKPVVFAHSTCAAAHLRGAWGAIAGLGNRPLGAMLFTHPLVKRMPLHYQPLHPHHPLHRSASRISHLPHTLWARRSLFYLHGAPLLVTEVFLPDILQLHIPG